MIQKFFWNLVNGTKYFENIFNLFLNALCLRCVKRYKVVLMENEFSLCFHVAKLTIKLTLWKFIFEIFHYNCKKSMELGFDGCISFVSKTALIDYYNKSLGAIKTMGQRMAILEPEAENLIKRYFKTK